MTEAIYRRLSLFVSLIVIPISVSGAASLTELTSVEREALQARMRRFYADPKDPAPMLEAVPKHSATTGERARPNRILLLPGSSPTSPMLRLAQAKGTKQYRQWYCEEFLKKHFGISCDEPWSSVESNDTVERMTATWMAPEEVVHDLDQVPTSGVTGVALWSDDYWRTQWGGTSYRFQEGKHFSHYATAVGDYTQPREWNLLASNPIAELISETIARWSPAEKYDLTVGDDKLTLTIEQKKEGEPISGGGNVEGWIGICHGWAAAALAVPKPMKPVTTVTKGGVKVLWHPHDVRAMVSLAWAKGLGINNYSGARCRPKEPALYSNGRIIDPECFDSNPATFHLVLGNLVGKARHSFIMDKSYDYEVWNQPIHSYEFTYFNPLNPGAQSKNWKEVSVPYDATFKASDRFQTPNTRGIRAVPSDDGRIKQIVGVIAVVVYAAEVAPRAGDPMPELLNRVTYTYDLELEERNGVLVARGGEWHQNAHPDFLWAPRKGAVALTKHDETAITYAIGEPAPAATLEVARTASASGYPLCGVLKELINNSAEGAAYGCAR